MQDTVLLKRFAALFLIISISLLFSSCMLLHLVLPDDPGSRDWKCVLINNYQIAELSAGKIILGKIDDEGIGEIVIEPCVIAYCVNEKYIGIQQKEYSDSQQAVEESISPDYYLVDTVSNDVFGPYTQYEYEQKCTELDIYGMGEWIPTSPRPEDAVYE